MVYIIKENLFNLYICICKRVHEHTCTSSKWKIYLFNLIKALVFSSILLFYFIKLMNYIFNFWIDFVIVSKFTVIPCSFPCNLILCSIYAVIIYCEISGPAFSGAHASCSCRINSLVLLIWCINFCRKVNLEMDDNSDSTSRHGKLQKSN